MTDHSNPSARANDNQPAIASIDGGTPVALAVKAQTEETKTSMLDRLATLCYITSAVAFAVSIYKSHQSDKLFRETYKAFFAGRGA